MAVLFWEKNEEKGSKNRFQFLWMKPNCHPTSGATGSIAARWPGRPKDRIGRVAACVLGEPGLIEVQVTSD
jgi:hypothetical protein